MFARRKKIDWALDSDEVVRLKLDYNNLCDNRDNMACVIIAILFLNFLVSMGWV